jgi:hypothetical protein
MVPHRGDPDRRTSPDRQQIVRSNSLQRNTAWRANENIRDDVKQMRETLSVVYRRMLKIEAEIREWKPIRQADDLGRITRWRNATARALASGSSGGSFHARPLGVCCTIVGTLIVAAWAGFGRPHRRAGGDDGHGPARPAWTGTLTLPLPPHPGQTILFPPTTSTSGFAWRT